MEQPFAGIDLRLRLGTVDLMFSLIVFNTSVPDVLHSWQKLNVTAKYNSNVTDQLKQTVV